MQASMIALLHWKQRTSFIKNHHDIVESKQKIFGIEDFESCGRAIPKSLNFFHVLPTC